MVNNPFCWNDFLQMEVVRRNDVAEIIVDYHESKPVRLIGFTADLELSDYEVMELGYEYYERLVQFLTH